MSSHRNQAPWVRGWPGRRLRSLRQADRRLPQDAGVIAVITALLAALMFVFAAIAVDVGRWYSEGQRLQRAVDAAALAGVPYLPGDLEKAREAARDLIAKNGYRTFVPDSNITIGDRPSRLQVTMSSTIPNAFGTIVGARFKTVTRSAMADFAETAHVGGDCNVLGHAPPNTSNQTLDEFCATDGTYWNSIAGPDAAKASGDRFATRRCAAGNSNCLGTRNLDYSGGADVFGQSYYVYRISATRPLSSMTVQAFDPMFVDVGDHCSEPDKLKQTVDGLWDLGASPIVPDAPQRYAWGDSTTTPATPGTFCTGDTLLDRPVDPALAATEAAKLNTTFLMLNPTDTQDPLKSTPACAGTPPSFGGFSGDLTQALVPTEPGYNPVVVQSFRQWVDICRVTNPVRNGDYYLLVRTNVPSGASAGRMLNPAEDSTAGGNGLNRFGLRVAVAGGSLRDVTISAVERLPVQADLDGVGMPLARVTSANAGGLLTVSLFDIGDSPDAGGQAAQVQITEPSGGTPAGCRATGEVKTSPTGDFSTASCTLRNITSGYDGRIQRIEVPIPDDYTCNDADPASCWYRMRIGYPGAAFPPGFTPKDTMTWSASLDGDPVRLVR